MNLAPGHHEFFSAKCVQFPLTFYGMKQDAGDFAFVSIIIHFWDKP